MKIITKLNMYVQRHATSIMVKFTFILITKRKKGGYYKVTNWLIEDYVHNILIFDNKF